MEAHFWTTEGCHQNLSCATAAWWIFFSYSFSSSCHKETPHPETQREIQRTSIVEQLSSVLPPEQPPSASFPPPHSHGLGSSQWHLGIESPRSKKVFTFSSNEKYYMRKLAPTLYYYGGFSLDKKGCFLQILCHLTVLANITVMF